MVSIVTLKLNLYTINLDEISGTQDVLHGQTTFFLFVIRHGEKWAG